MQQSFPLNYKDCPSFFSKIRHPLRFQGWKKQKSYFEGWYYKVVAVDQNLAFAVIPGISIKNENDQHAFIQVIDGIRCRSDYYKYPISDFKAAIDNHYIEIGPNVFSEKVMSLNLPMIKGNLTSSSWQKLPFTLKRPGIMGWYSYIPTMQCNHGLGSFLHYWSGEITVGPNNYTLKRAQGYVEKDWGKSFPRSWIWTQCNTFDCQDEVSVFASVAHIPWKSTHFIGFLGAIWHAGEIDIFSTYTGTIRHTTLNDDNVVIRLSKKDKILDLTITKAPGADLISPLSGEMRGKVNESIQAKMYMKYQSDSKCIEANGSYAGLEVAGPVEELLT